MPDPTKKILLTEEQIKQCAAMSGIGLTLKQMAHILGVSKSTIERRMADQPELVEALEKGRAEASEKVRSVAYKMATSGKNPVMTIFWLKAREGFREARDVNVNFSSVPDKELLAAVPEAIQLLEGEIVEGEDE